MVSLPFAHGPRSALESRLMVASGFPSSIHRPFHSSLIFRATHSQRLQLERPPHCGNSPRLFLQLLQDWPEDPAPKFSEPLLSASRLSLRTEYRFSLGAACSSQFCWIALAVLLWEPPLFTADIHMIDSLLH